MYPKDSVPLILGWTHSERQRERRLHSETTRTSFVGDQTTEHVCGGLFLRTDRDGTILNRKGRLIHTYVEPIFTFGFDFQKFSFDPVHIGLV